MAGIRKMIWQKIEEAQALHQRDEFLPGGRFGGPCIGCGKEWPCPTVRILGEIEDAALNEIGR